MLGARSAAKMLVLHAWRAQRSENIGFAGLARAAQEKMLGLHDWRAQRSENFRCFWEIWEFSKLGPNCDPTGTQLSPKSGPRENWDPAGTQLGPNRGPNRGPNFLQKVNPRDFGGASASYLQKQVRTPLVQALFGELH